MKIISFVLIIFLGACKPLFNPTSTHLPAPSKVDLEKYKNEISKYGLTNNDTLLDIGCGNFDFDETISRLYPGISFILEDVDLKIKRRIDKLKRHAKSNSFIGKLNFTIGTNDTIPLPSFLYKTILCRKTMHEFNNPSKMVKEFKRLMASDGTIIIVESPPIFNGETDRYCKKKYLTKDEIINTFVENGFKLTSADTSTFIYRNDDRNFNILKFSN